MTYDPGGQQAAATGAGFSFVGRRRELARVLDAVRHQPAVVLIEGEAGIGKTRLLQEAASALAADDWPVLQGLCHPLREPVPFGPVVDALRGAEAWLPPVARLPRAVGALAPLLPDLADRLPPPLPHTEDGPAERELRVAAIRSLLAAVGPSVLIIDDLHWVDVATRELLLLLARDLPPTLSLVLSYRAEDVPQGSHVLGPAYRRPPRTSGATIHLRPLLEQDVADLAEAALGQDSSPSLVRVLFRRSEGLPLVAEEDLLTLAERHGERPGADTLASDLEQAAVPTALRETVSERLSGLSPDGAAIVDAAAVLAGPAAESVLAAVADLDAEQSSRGLTEALQTVSLRETAPDQYAFRHVLAQQVAYERIPGPRRRRLHRRAIDALTERTPPPRVHIAHHLLALGDREEWLKAAEAAAKEAIAVDDPGTAVTLLHQILDQDHLPGDLRSRAALALGKISLDFADAAASTRVLGRILTDPRLPVADRGEIRLGLGLLLVTQAYDRAGFREIERAVDELATRPSRAVRAMVALAIDEKGEGWEWLERAERTVADGGCGEAGVAAVRTARLTLLAREGNPEVWTLLDDLPRHSEDLEVLRHSMRALYNVGDLAIELGHDRKAAELLTEAMDVSRRARATKTEGYVLINRLRLASLAGDWNGLEARFGDIGREFPDLEMGEEEQHMALGWLDTARGQWARALEHFGTVAAVRETGFTVTPSLRAAAAIVSLQLAQGDPAPAWATAAPAVAELRRARAWARATGLVPAAVEAALAAGDRDAARRLADDAEQGLRGCDSPAAAAELRLARGLLDRDTDSAAAAAHFEAAQRMWADIGRPYNTALANERLGHALAADDDPAKAAAHLARSVEIFTRLGATSDRARCEHALRDLGLARPSSRGRRGYGQDLSPRERQVAELLAQDLSNQDIAQALFLSPRTIEHHVARVLGKLGVTRGEVRTALERASQGPPEAPGPGNRPLT
ncbi:AAA family ATPase [Streptomyces sp. NPDC051976]|uniref:ATP-binding protein n=1 Tax=Streptomyces sp. NPDC051976 TaxID=3154947 RepID=UPI003414A059